MRKLAILALIVLIGGTIIITLGLTNYQGFGDWVGGNIQSSVVAPARNWAVDTWLFIGTSGWYILATVVGISVVGGLFMTAIVYGLVWQKLIQGKLLHKTVPSTTPLASMQRGLTTNIPVASQPEAAPAAKNPVSETKEEAE